MDELNDNSKDPQPAKPQQNGSSNPGGSGPSSPFELRRHRSFYDSSGNTLHHAQQDKRRASTKATMSKTKSSNQILNFFRSQSHEPKNNYNNNNCEENLDDNGNSNVDVVPTSEGSEVPIAKPRKQRPQSLYTKTRSSRGVFMHRTSGIETTPETPEFTQFLASELSSVGNDTVSPSQVLTSIMTNSVSSQSSTENGFNGQSTGDQSARYSSSRSSVSSSDSFTSCGVDGDQNYGNDFDKTLVEIKDENRYGTKKIIGLRAICVAVYNSLNSCTIY